MLWRRTRRAETPMCVNHDVQQAKIASLKGMHRRDIVRGLWAGTLVIGTAGASGCASAAKFFAPTDEQLMPLAAQAWEQTKAETPISKDVKANQRIQAVGARI